jgi:uncharacterized membrane protein YhaH (DUF805 family)
MDKSNNIYNYKTPKSGNDEVSYFLTTGRITRRAFFLRLLLAVALFMLSHLIYVNVAVQNYWYYTELGGGEIQEDAKNVEITYNVFKTFDEIILPIILGVFVLIQGAKRMHDTNKSGWFILLPVIDILYLFSDGTEGNNGYGIDPKPQKKIKYFDELKKNDK